MSKSAATQARERFIDSMQRLQPGAKLEYRESVWTITRNQRTETGAALTLRQGQAEVKKYVPVCFTGPALQDAGLRFVQHAPRQQEIAA